MRGLGRHLIAELYDADRAALDDEAHLRWVLAEAVAASGGTLLAISAHHFSPQGVTAVALVAESHLALHSWPEHGYLAMDYFTCGEHVDASRALTVVQDAVGAKRVEVREIVRGEEV